MDGLELKADCGRCFGLCCVALPFTASADFAFDKEAGDPCRHLEPDFRCGIHAHLRESGLQGCVAYDCFGAGQKVSQVTFGGRDWRADPARAGAMFAVLPVMGRLHELLWYLDEARTRVSVPALRREVDAAFDRVASLSDAAPDDLLDLDLPAVLGEVAPLLRRVADEVRAGTEGPGPDHSRADLAGARLAGADLRGATLRGAVLIAADLSGADLRDAELLGADLRDADLGGADLRGALFLTQAQVAAAKGDPATALPGSLDRPAHWQPG